jgi:hypothetical protein
MRFGEVKLEKVIRGVAREFLRAAVSDRHQLITFDALVNKTMSTVKPLVPFSADKPVVL